MSSEGALIIYGRGGNSGSLKWVADDLLANQLATYSPDNVLIQDISRRDAFFNYLSTTDFPFKIKELHIFSHSVGGALFLGYQDPLIAQMRQTIVSDHIGGTANYLSVLGAEKGAVFTDDLIRSPYRELREKIQNAFAEEAQIKLWGPNAGVSGWIYSDADESGKPVFDAATRGASYYWRALNECNSPKPSIAQALANYCRVPVLARSTANGVYAPIEEAWVRGISRTEAGASLETGPYNTRYRFVPLEEQWVHSSPGCKVTPQNVRIPVQELDISSRGLGQGEYREYEPQ